MKLLRFGVFLAAGLIVSGCGTFEPPPPTCPNVAIVKGLERAEIRLSKDGIDANLDIRLGPINGGCIVQSRSVVLDYAFDLIASNSSPFSVDGLTVEFFVSVLYQDEIVDKSMFSSEAINLPAAGSALTQEVFRQTLELGESELASDYDILIGLALPKEIGLRQRQAF